mmetsp:Transcript_65433/g.202870  ORF Transcript_65433/g.202870 Transcript_65433/m.202870 type:complete len:333 (-) Transcript_65433:104-1102(-)
MPRAHGRHGPGAVARGEREPEHPRGADLAHRRALRSEGGHEDPNRQHADWHGEGLARGEGHGLHRALHGRRGLLRAQVQPLRRAHPRAGRHRDLRPSLGRAEEQARGQEGLRRRAQPGAGDALPPGRWRQGRTFCRCRSCGGSTDRGGGRWAEVGFREDLVRGEGLRLPLGRRRLGRHLLPQELARGRPDARAGRPSALRGAVEPGEGQEHRDQGGRRSWRQPVPDGPASRCGRRGAGLARGAHHRPAGHEHGGVRQGRLRPLWDNLGVHSATGRCAGPGGHAAHGGHCAGHVALPQPRREHAGRPRLAHPRRLCQQRHQRRLRQSRHRDMG